MLKVFTIVFALLTTLCSAGLFSDTPALAGASRERITLMLTGPHCHEAQPPLEAILHDTDGVFAVDGTSIPGHMLLDVERGKISEENILAVVQTTIGTPLSCRVEVMQSCITTPTLTRIDATAK